MHVGHPYIPLFKIQRIFDLLVLCYNYIDTHIRIQLESSLFFLFSTLKVPNGNQISLGIALDVLVVKVPVLFSFVLGS